MSGRPSADNLLERPDGFLTRTDLSDLGLPRGAVDAIFRALPVVVFPGTRRPLIRVEDYLAFVAEHTYCDDRVRQRERRTRPTRSVQEPSDRARRWAR